MSFSDDKRTDGRINIYFSEVYVLGMAFKTWNGNLVKMVKISSLTEVQDIMAYNKNKRSNGKSKEQYKRQAKCPVQS